jgi:hypothetical protein
MMLDGLVSLAVKKRRWHGVVRLLHNGELLNEEVFDTLDGARNALAHWRHDYNHVHPHSSLGGLTPAAARAGRSGLTKGIARLPLSDRRRPIDGTRATAAPRGRLTA